MISETTSELTTSTTDDLTIEPTGNGRNVRQTCDVIKDCNLSSVNDGSCISYDNEVICFCDDESCFQPLFVDVNERLDDMDSRGLWPFVRICIDDCYMDGAWLLTGKFILFDSYLILEQNSSSRDMTVFGGLLNSVQEE